MDSARVESFAGQVFQAMIGFQKISGIYLGDKLGFYRSLHEDGSATSVELAARTGTDERYAREWLEYQAVNGILEVADASAGPTDRRFSLPAEHGAVLAEVENPNYLGSAGAVLLGTIRPIDAIVAGYRTGAGVPYEAYGDDLVCGIAAFNRPIFMSSIGQEWIPAMPDVDAALRQPGARVADIGMGMAWSSIAIARAYPNATVDGFDLDEQSVALANDNITREGLSDRVHAAVRDAGDPDLSGHTIWLARSSVSTTCPIRLRRWRPCGGWSVTEARFSWSMSAYKMSSLHQPTRSSRYCTDLAWCIACKWVGSRRLRLRQEPSSGDRPWRSTRAKRVSPRSKNSSSRTRSIASTGCAGRFVRGESGWLCCDPCCDRTGVRPSSRERLLLVAFLGIFDRDGSGAGRAQIARRSGAFRPARRRL